MSHIKNIGERVASIRGNMGVIAFAELVGVSRKTIQRWEDGLVIPDGNSMLLLKEKFGVDPNWLLTGESASIDHGIVVSDAEEVELVQIFRQLERKSKSRETLLNLFRLYAKPVGVEMPKAAPQTEAPKPVPRRGRRFGAGAQPGTVAFKAGQDKQAVVFGKSKPAAVPKKKGKTES